jgi:hypothetical protein
MKHFLVAAGLALALSAGSARPQDAHDGKGDEANDLPDSTLTVIPEGAELPAVVTDNLDLPKHGEDYLPAVQGVEHGGAGLETANLAREDGRAFGEALAAAAEQSREDFEHGSKPDLGTLLPDQATSVPDVPDVSGVTNVPGAPTSPGQP